ncbi:Oxalate:formate antiporter [Neomoorella glycerini]|uniref:Oxalate:formate antiporter n=1 Tax=Neomoorella glycerini TaxID=55779 RepID=A0A6I5ZMQ4_9FIRM|nr:Oxalate:formate antiporter [Moorella glycerini]
MLLDKGAGERYRWFYPVAAFIIGMSVYITGLWTLFYPYIMEHYKLNVVAQVALASSLTGVGSMVIGPPIAGLLFDKYGPKIPLALAGAIFVAGAVIVSLTLTPMEWVAAKYYWYIGSAVIGFGIGLYGGTWPATMARWFPDKIGTAMGIAAAGTGLATTIYAPITAVLIKSLGFSNLFRILACIGFVVLYGGVMLWKVPSPDWVPFGQKPKSGAGEKTTPAGKEHFTLKEAVKDIRFWHLYTCFFCAAFAALFFTTNVSMIILEGLTKTGTDRQYVVRTVVPMFLTLTALAGAAGRLIWGNLMDRIGGPWRTLPIVYFTSGVMIAVFYLGYTSVAWIMIAGAIWYFLFGGEPTVHYAAVPYLFGRKSIGTIMTVLNAFSVGLGIVLGPYVGAFIRDLTGAYKWSLALAITLRIIATLVALNGLRISQRNFKSQADTRAASS